MNKAFVFRIYPNEEQRILLAKTFGCVRFIWNQMLSDKKDCYETTGQSLKTTPAKYKKDYPFLSEVDSLALANEQLSLEKAYKNFWNGKGRMGFPRFKSRHNDRSSYTTNCVNGNIEIADSRIKLPKLKWVTIKQHREIPEDYRLKSCTVSQDPDGKYYISVLFAYEETIKQQKIEKITGLDYSMKKSCKTPQKSIEPEKRFSPQAKQADNQCLRCGCSGKSQHERYVKGITLWEICP